METKRGNNELINDLSGGVNLFADPSKIAENEFTQYENLIGWAQGRFFNATKRKGVERYNTATTNSQVEIQNIYQFKNPSTTKNLDRLLVKSASTIEYLSGSSLNDIVTGLGSGKVDFETARTNLYIAGLVNGSSTPISNAFYDSTNYLNVGAIPPKLETGVTPTLTGNGTGSTFPAGDYYYLITYLYDGSQESGVLLVELDIPSVTLASQKSSIVIASIPTGNARVTARKIYRSKKDDFTNFYFVTSINDNSTTQYKDTTPDSSLGTAISLETFLQLNQPYISKYNTFHKDRMVQGNLVEQRFLPLSSSDVSAADALVTGSLPDGTYKFRFYKVWGYYDPDTFSKTVLKAMPYVEKTVNMSTGDAGTVLLTYSGTPGNWLESIVVLGTNAGGSDYFWWDTLSGTHTTAQWGSVPPDAQVALTTSTPLSELPHYIAVSKSGEPDVFPETQTLAIGKSGQAITGMFSEPHRLIVFKERSIYQVETEVDNFRFWKTELLVEHIGTSAKNNVVKLPAGGYFFYGSDSNFYLWDGYNQPQRISDPIYSEALAITSVHCAYDKIRNWIWCIYNKSGVTGRSLIFDLNNGKWYMFVENGTDLKLGSPYQLTDGTMIFGGTNYGSIMKYGTNNQDNLNTSGSTFADTQIKVKLQSRFYETYRNVKEILAKLYSSGNGTLSIYYGVDASESSTSVSLSSSTLARVRKGINANAKQFYFRFENADNIALSFQQIGHKYEPIHTESDGF